ncbi:response regulator transcription factor [Metabacillus rhizolycopersici]|uniref:Response regulator n=1 Tax=Metabacillus rhizolycopersici TaxID=2875709 RepID=A0ABS7UW56_9BACI|nr:response regulator [Metabacillus rhizolycopersici]MBZ5752170.1 response regulator [Metabacillus rhizolycopersici]
MIRIAILDDEELIREGIKFKFPFLNHDFEIAYEGDDGHDLLEKLKSSDVSIDLFLVDMMMPKLKGIDFIREVSEFYKPANFIVISGYDDFSYVKEALKLGVSDYLLKPIDPNELTSVLLKEQDKIHTLRKSKFEHLRDEISHHLSKKEEIAKLSENARSYLQEFINNDSTIHIVLLGNLYSPKSFTDIRTSLEELLSDNQVLIWIYGIPQFFICITEKGFTQKLMDLINYQTVTTISFENMKDLKHLSSYFTKAIPLMSSLLTLGEKKVFTINIEKDCVDVNLLNKEEIEHTQISNLKYLIDCEDVKTSLNALIIILNQKIPQNIKEHAFQLFMWKHYHSEVLLEWLQSFDSPQLFQEQCLNFINALNEDKYQLTGKGILDRVIKDLSQEYATKKTLKDYADSYYIHPNYLARLFKQELGVTFIETITTIRMKKARELLKNESLKVSEVAQLVGYDDVRYFGQVFRRENNLTPSKYKNKIMTAKE